MASFLNQIDFNNLFNDETYLKAKNGPYSIRITPNNSRVFSGNKDIAVIGIMKNNINFGATANWETFSELVSGIIPNNSIIDAIKDTATNMATLGGAGLVNAGLVTKKFYKGGGGYLSISPEFRLLDWDNSGKVWEQFMALIALVLPRTDSSVKISEILEKISEPGSIIGQGVEFFKKAGQQIETAARTMVGDKSVDLGIHGLEEIGEGSLMLTESPSPVSVQIGNWFSHDNMVVDSITFDMSDKMTENGPLFMDVALQLSSREAMVLGKDGVNGMNVGNTKKDRTMEQTDINFQPTSKQFA
jgi:hypothetical protein